MEATPVDQFDKRLSSATFFNIVNYAIRLQRQRCFRPVSRGALRAAPARGLPR
jgi:hypothetical protein